jgi:hypothetical protein
MSGSHSKDRSDRLDFIFNFARDKELKEMKVDEMIEKKFTVLPIENEMDDKVRNSFIASLIKLQQTIDSSGKDWQKAKIAFVSIIRAQHKLSALGLLHDHLNIEAGEKRMFPHDPFINSLRALLANVILQIKLIKVEEKLIENTRATVEKELKTYKGGRDVTPIKNALDDLFNLFINDKNNFNDFNERDINLRFKKHLDVFIANLHKIESTVNQDHQSGFFAKHGGTKSKLVKTIKKIIEKIEPDKDKKAVSGPSKKSGKG